MYKVYVYIMGHIGRIAQTQEFLNSSHVTVLRLLSDNNLDVQDELEVFNIAVRWIEYKKDERICTVSELMKAIRFTRISPDELADRVETVDFVIQDPSTFQKIHNAYRYHSLTCKNSCLSKMIKLEPTRTGRIKPVHATPSVTAAISSLTNIAIRLKQTQIHNDCEDQRPQQQQINGGMMMQNVYQSENCGNQVDLRHCSIECASGKLQTRSSNVNIPWCQRDCSQYCQNSPCMNNNTSESSIPATTTYSSLPIQLTPFNSWQPYPSNYNMIVNPPDNMTMNNSKGGINVEYNPIIKMVPTNQCYKYSNDQYHIEHISSMLKQRIYFGIGFVNQCLLTNSIECYDLRKECWTNCIIHLPYPLMAMACAVINNERIVVYGGLRSKTKFNNKMFALDTNHMKWIIYPEQKNYISHSKMIFICGDLYLIGGLMPSSTSSSKLTTTNEIFRWNTNKNEWETWVQMNYPRYDPIVVQLDRSLLIFGGLSTELNDLVSTVEYFNVMNSQISIVHMKLPLNMVAACAIVFKTKDARLE
ncbi:unnamed protein product [Didymodactylos carnosus]|uniref:BACK domain-containing protein n=1 Tax=Didymodactylos carnosus TaxID=1234261 RepID=A0A813RQ90_9BILA|nr:unnamed protein product [Didymodactylos carnosus]CAF0830829.1 unnamed protein product [Didymodactylos carnosus]CAF3568067.1 unnamed protein product [Didymodactylos carnosus]CAF3615378.1 unnamed protein product [Didymodactylos carnosus]